MNILKLPLAAALLSCAFFAADASAKPLQRGAASWYGPGFHGRKTASGERFNAHAMTAAHKSAALRHQGARRQREDRTLRRGPDQRPRALRARPDHRPRPGSGAGARHPRHLLRVAAHRRLSRAVRTCRTADRPPAGPCRRGWRCGPCSRSRWRSRPSRPRPRRSPSARGSRRRGRRRGSRPARPRRRRSGSRRRTRPAATSRRCRAGCSRGSRSRSPSRSGSSRRGRSRRRGSRARPCS